MECLLRPEGVVVVFSALASLILFLAFKDGVKMIPWMLSKNLLKNCGNSQLEQIVQIDAELKSLVLYHSLIKYE